METGKIAEGMPGASMRWLLLVHQLPPKPAYLRVKIWRRLREIGAVALKNSLYVLPRTKQTIGDLQQLLALIEKSGGEGVICDSAFVAGLRDDQVQDLFNSARNADYQTLAKNLRQRAGRRKKNDAELKPALEKARQQLAQIAKIDFFGAAGGRTVEALLSQLEHSPIVRSENIGKALDKSSLTGRTWVTRQGVHVDRIACAWLIRRFIDPKAKFKFVAAKPYRQASGELRFDMADAEFTHEGDKCSFEVLLEKLCIGDKALGAIGEIIHDLDLKDGKFGRPETVGIGHVIAGICRTQGQDEARIARGKELFDDTYEQFRQR